LIWLTWRQSRVKAGVAATVLVAFAAVLAVTGPHLASVFANSKIGSCTGSVNDCGAYADDFLQQLYNQGLAASGFLAVGKYWMLYLLGIVTILVAPVLIGMFWGAPLIAGEFEAGTHYLVWNQSITRTRWLAVKLVLTGLGAIAVTEALSLMQAWWDAPINLAVARGACCSPLALNQFSAPLFATHGIAPLGYAAFAFALGVTAGALVRRAVPAMAITLAVFAVLQIAMPLWVRPHLLPPEHTLAPISSFGSLYVQIQNYTITFLADGWSQPDTWILSTDGAVNSAGEPVNALPPDCRQTIPAASGVSDNPALLDCLTSHGIQIAVTYQPASRYWAFQWAETAIYVALALALVGCCFWTIRRGVS
jgi:hypothetical protein